MSDPFADRPFPRGALLAAVALISGALLVATAARVSGIGTPQSPTTAVAESRSLRFELLPDDTLAVVDARRDRLIDVLAPDTNGFGFVRGVLRGFAHERRRHRIDPQKPVLQLTRWIDGHLSLADPKTGLHIDLGGFGSTNVQAFARFLVLPLRGES